MLKEIVAYVTDFAHVIATVTGIDIEVVNSDLTRVAGTGVYAAGVGSSIESAGQIYSLALSRGETIFIDDPKENPVCLGCPECDNCRERLTLCTPIVADGVTLGIIGLVCFNNDDRDKILAQRDIYISFVQQIADAIARVARSENLARKNRQRLAMLLQVIDTNSRGILIVDRNGRISFINDTARQELGLENADAQVPVEIAKTGEMSSDMDEYAVVLPPADGAAAENRHMVIGRLTPLGQGDPVFDRVLVFDSKPRLTAMLSRLGGASDNASDLDAIIGDSHVIRDLKKRVRQIADTASTVLITGESGTGKEMFARAIHAASPRRDKPFIAINCGAIPDALLESELFGYVRGAFTNADPSGRMGKFELADRGVLFLDEIGSMPLYLQVKLLRILQERSFARLGSNNLISLDIRIIAATNEKLPELIAQRGFREDLYYRLNVIPLEIPPLRHRKDDIPVLAEYFLNRYCRLLSKPPIRLSPTLLDSLRAYHWPGNIREFENCIEYMVNMHDGGSLSVASLPPKLANPQSPTPAAPSAFASSQPIAQAGDEAIIPLAEMERELIRRAIRHFGDTAEGKRKAAEALGIGIATLYRKLKTNGS